MELLRLTTAGSVDDGKSTLIGRLLHDCNAIFEDQLLSVKKSSEKRGNGELDFALLTDGLSAEREQGITIDVAYRYFTTTKRRFIIADVPGHEQYTRNMVTGASTADLAIILIDARKGLQIQTKRHLFVAALLGISHILMAVNKMDMVDYSQDIFNTIKRETVDFASKLNIKDLQFVPISALKGDMVVDRGKNMDWFGGRTIINYLENLEISTDRNLLDFRLPIQSVIRPNQDFRGYMGRIEGGVIHEGDEVTILPSVKKSKVKAIYVGNEKVDTAFNPQSVLLTLEDEIDVSRGEMLVRSKNLPDVSNHLETTVCWMSEESLKVGKSYLIKHTTRTTRGTFEILRHKINIDTLHREAGEELDVNEIGKLYLRTTEPLIFDAYNRNSNTGSFIVIDEFTNETVAAGIILSRTRDLDIREGASNVAASKGGVIWFTGLSGAGKTTIANKVYEQLSTLGVKCQQLDGDIMREVLCKDLAFSKEDRDTNIDRAAYVARLLAKHGVLVIASFISPYKAQRKVVRNSVDNFVEIFVNTPLEICEERDVKGLYAKARSGEIGNFTGISDPYEKPVNPEIELMTNGCSLEESVEKVMQYLRDNSYVE
jgi:bifunctional enzyme CysN/CysC